MALRARQRQQRDSDFVGSMRVTVLIPTIEENASLRETVQSLIPVDDVLEIILVTCERTSPGTLTTCRELELAHKGGVFRVGQPPQITQVSILGVHEPTSGLMMTVV